jgi:hypothetical protein
MPTPAKSGLVDPLVANTHLGQTSRPIAKQPADKVRLEDDPIELASDDDHAPPIPGVKPGDSVAKKIVAFGSEARQFSENFKRAPAVTGRGACRVKSFHCKYSDEGLRYLDNSINTWLDAHPEVEVKFVSQTVHEFEGKIREPALVLNLWF